MKKLFYIILSLFLIVTSLSPIYALDVHINDSGNIFNYYTENNLKNIVKQYQNKYSFHIVIVTTCENDDNFDFQKYTDQYYQDLYQQEDGIIFGFYIKQIPGAYSPTIEKNIITYGHVSQYFDQDIDANEILGYGEYEYVDNIQTILYDIGLKMDGLTSPRYVIDQACMLSYDEYQQIDQEINELRNKYNMDFVIITKCYISKYIMTYADDFYDSGNYRQDGLLLIIDLGEREWRISTSGKAIEAFTSWGISYIGQETISKLFEAGTYSTFSEFLEYVDKFIDQNEHGLPYSSNYHFGLPNSNEEPVSTPTVKKSTTSTEVVSNVFISLITALIFAFMINLFRLWKNSKPKKSIRHANQYIKKNSFHLMRNEDLFLYSSINKTRKPQHDDSHQSHSSGSAKQSSPSRTRVSSSTHSAKSSTHTSSSGRTHGGGGGHF